MTQHTVKPLRTVRSGSRLRGQRGGQRGKEVLGTLASILSHQSIHDNQCGHGLNDWHGTRHDTGVVAALGLEDTLLQTVGGGVLGLADSRRGLEGDAEVDRGTVGDTTLHTTGVIGLRGETLIIGDNEGVVVDGAGHLAATEARANLEALGGGDAQHRVGQLRLKLVKARLTQADGHVTDHAGDSTTDAILRVAELLDNLGHACGGLGLWAADRGEAVYCRAVDSLEELQILRVGRGGRVFGGWGEEVLVANGRNEGDDLDIVRELEVLLCDSAGSDTT